MGISRSHAKVSIIMMMMILIGVISPFSVYATSYLNQPYWDCVDSGYHLDYDGDSVYMSNVSSGAGKWNYYKSGVIRHDTILTNNDVYVRDESYNYSWVGQAQSNGTIYFNTNKMYGLTQIQRTNVAAHELGHMLGLGHSTEGSIMYSNSSTYTYSVIPSQNDKDSYDDAYNNHY